MPSAAGYRRLLRRKGAEALTGKAMGDDPLFMKISFPAVDRQGVRLSAGPSEGPCGPSANAGALLCRKRPKSANFFWQLSVGEAAVCAERAADPRL